jgi:hypothetical protein
MTRMIEERNERGIALLTVLLVGFALSAIALASTMWILNAQLVQKSGERAAILNDVAVAALEEGRARIAATPALYPSFGHDTLDNWVTVTDASGATIPCVRRSVYAGPDGVTSGQYGVFGTIISAVRDTFGNQVVRRLQINQESFAKYAYFTTVEGNIVFANNDQIWGPVHSNDQIEVHSSGATFHSTVTTAASSIQGEGYGTYNGGPAKKNVPAIPLPTTTAFSALQTRATSGGFNIVGNTNGGAAGEASIRLDFVAIDLNADGDSTDAGEGFVRIYQDNARPWYVTAQISGVSGQDIRRSPNCGAPVRDAGANWANVIGNPAATATDIVFRTAADTNPTGATNWRVEDAEDVLTTNNVKWFCYLGGDPRLDQTKWAVTGTRAAAYDTAAWNANVGAWTSGGVAGWRPRPGGMGSPPTSIPAWAARPDRNYLWPIGREWNPNWEGVIYISGKVAISGVLNGRVTLASSNNIIIADDVRTAIDPGVDCGHILGLFSGDSVIVADNMINTPQTVPTRAGQRTYDLTSEEDIHAVVLALEIFGAERYDEGPDDGEDCSISDSGRGCLSLKGGIIQKTRGAVGLTSGEGYIKRYEYNSCALSDPPPYFPTTGRFARNRIYELDPRNFNVVSWFAANQNN